MHTNDTTHRRPALILATCTLILSQGLAAEMQEVAIDFYPLGDSGQGYPITLSMQTEFVPGGRPYEPAEEPFPEGTVERFLTDYAAVLREGTVEAALPFWLAEEHQEARQTLEPVFEKQRALFQQVVESRLYTKARYGRFLLAAVRHERPETEALVTIYPLVATDEGWALSNALQSDPIFQLLFFLFHEGRGFDRPLGAQQ